VFLKDFPNHKVCLFLVGSKTCLEVLSMCEQSVLLV